MIKYDQEHPQLKVDWSPGKTHVMELQSDGSWKIVVDYVLPDNKAKWITPLALPMAALFAAADYATWPSKSGHHCGATIYTSKVYIDMIEGGECDDVSTELVRRIHYLKDMCFMFNFEIYNG